MFIRGYTVGPYSTNCFILGDEETKKAAIIDPGERGAAIADKIEEHGYEPIMILATHGHFDHIAGVQQLLNAWYQKHPEAEIPVYIHEADYPCAPAGLVNGISLQGVPNLHYYADGDTLQLGNLTIEVIGTPGRTAGGVTLKVEDVLFVGDTLFCGSCGRTDFDSSSIHQMYASLKKLAELPGDYQVFPGHDRPTTMEAEREQNPYVAYAVTRDRRKFRR